jgi:hypothetical protein
MGIMKWRYNKESDDYAGYVGRMKVFKIIEDMQHRNSRIKGTGDWILISTRIPFLEPGRFVNPSSAKGYAESVIDRIQKNFSQGELKKSFRQSGKKG